MGHKQFAVVQAFRNTSGERSGVSPPVHCIRTGKLTHAARQFPDLCPRGA